MFKLLTIGIFFFANIILAKIDAAQFAKSKFVKHGINALEYGAMIAVPYHLFKDYWLIGALLFLRLLVFNISLSLFRKLKWYYVSPERKSIIDRIAFSIFGYNGKLMYAVYLAVLICLICKIYLW